MISAIPAILTAQHLAFCLRDHDCRGGRSRSQVQPLAAASQVEAGQSIFTDLQQQAGVEGCFEVKQSRHGQGVFATRDLAKGEVMMRVPQDACIMIDYESGLSIPNLPWPRLRKGLQQRDDHPWDILQALALLDALAGDAGAFWEAYANEVLPQPQFLALPLCLPPRLLLEVQHEEVMQAALRQKERLSGLFPGLASPMGPELPTFFEWAFACVRSRAFRLGDQRFAYVPFMDVANHAERPNAAFRHARIGAEVELVAMGTLRSGQEATISYTGPGGTPSKEMMQQYGFVPEGGNAADRIPFSKAIIAGRTLSLPRIEQLLGEQVFMQMLGGQHRHVTAVIKSLPLHEDGDPAGPLPEKERQLAESLRHQCVSMMEGWRTTLEEDVELLAAAAEDGDPRLQAVLRYRLDRKKLLTSAEALLRLYNRAD